MKKTYFDGTKKTWTCFTGIMVMFFICGFTANAQPPQIWWDGNPGNWQTDAPGMFIYKYIPDNYMLGQPDNQFQQGSKDYKYAADNSWTEGQTKNKNDLANSAVAVDAGMNYLYFAGDRARVQGAAQIGFWLLLNGTMAVPPTAKFGSFAPDHMEGDLLVVADFSQGGRQADITLYKWVGGGSGEGNLLEIDPTGIAVAQNNNDTYNVPGNWQYDGDTYRKNAFYEGYIDLDRVLGGKKVDFCKATWLLECRSSKELNASLDDFACGKFADEIPCAITGPDVVCPKDEITFCGPVGPYTYKWVITDGYFTGPDNQQCMHLVAPNHCGEFVITLTVKDVLGCEKTCEKKFKVVDSEFPVYKDCPSGVVELGCDPDPGKYACTLNLNNWSDNCRINSKEIIAGTPKPDETGCGWSVTHYTYAIDYCGHKSICEQKFHWIVDKEKPYALNCPKPRELGCNPTPDKWAPGVIEWKDNCGVTEKGVDIGKPVAIDGCKWGVKHVHWAKDFCGYKGECVEFITWKVDLTPPVLPPLPKGGDLGCNPAKLPSCMEGLRANDFCDGPVPVKCVAGAIGDLPKCGKTQTFTYSAIDECLNPVSQDVVYTWKEDLVPPVPYPTPTDLVFACGQTIVIPPVEFTDACDGPVPSKCEVVGHPGADCATFDYPVGETEICYTSEDLCHNSNTICVKVIVQPCPCETAYATLENENSTCFIPDFSRWGWTNLIEAEGTYLLPLYASAAHCLDGDLVGEVKVVYAGGKVSVAYTPYPGYSFESTSVYVGVDKYPSNNGVWTVAPGQYTYDPEATYTAPFYVIAHADVCELKSAPVPGGDQGTNSLMVYPNPFTRFVTFEFVSEKDAHAVLEIHNVLGQRVVTLINKQVEAGVLNRVEYTPQGQESGIFFYRLKLDGTVMKGKLLFTK